jgi:hypothetical protein
MDELINVISTLINHKRLYSKRGNVSRKSGVAYALFFCVLFVLFYQISYTLTQDEFALSFYLIVLIMDFLIKFLLYNVQVNILPYLVLPIEKKTLIKSVLLIETIRIWNLYWVISLAFLFFNHFFSDTNLNGIVFSVNLFLLFLLNSYYVIAIKNSMSRIISFLLLPLFLVLLLPVYFTFYINIVCVIITLTLIIGLFYANIYILINKLYQQLNERSI